MSIMTAVPVPWICLMLFATFRQATANDFTVQTPQKSISAPSGSSVIFPCHLSPPMNALNLEIRWHRPDAYKVPMLLQKTPIKPDQELDKQYSGRVSLVGALEKGDVSMRLENITLADRGEYVCYAKSTQWYESATVNLQVKVVGSAIAVSVGETTEGQVNVTCATDGWSPQPNLTWTNRQGSLPGSPTMHSEDDDGLVRVSSWLLRSPSESDWITCCVGLSDQERRESKILPFISGTQAEPNTSGSGGVTALFIITLLVLVALLIGMAVAYKKGFVQISRTPETPQGEKSACTGAEESLLEPTGNKEKRPSSDKETNTLKTEMAEKGINTEPPRIIVTPEWDSLSSYAVPNIHLDTNTVPPFLEVKEGKSSKEEKKGAGVKTEVWCPDPARVQGHGDRDPHVLCQEISNRGKYCWGVKIWTTPKIKGETNDKKIKQKQSWYVGVCRDSTEKYKKVPLTPENGFWVLQYEKGTGLFANTDPPTPVPMTDLFKRLGVFLDCDKHTLSFYNVDTNSHLCTFENVGGMSGGDVLFPLISPGIRDSEVMRVCTYVEM